MMPSPPLFLGLDLSTQRLKAILISEDSRVLHTCTVGYDEELPSHMTTKGAIFGPSGEITSPVLMWLEAVDLLFDKMRCAGVDFGSISCVAGAAQQHGSVYWSKDAETILRSLKPDEPLATQLCPQAFALPNAPIWQDSSTTADCHALEEAAGGAESLAELTGSRAYERFTGPQIAKVRRVNLNAYESTARISLISSFLASLFLGRIAPIEVADASGMNLMNVLTCEWDNHLLHACGGPELREKLGPEPVVGGTILGNISEWWVRRWGFSLGCMVAPFTGDNPATVVPFSYLGDAILSLGTSTTLLLSIPPSDTAPRRFTTSHLLSHPTTSNAHIAMLCYKNGALARERIRDRYANGTWSRFNQLVNSPSLGSDGYLGLYYPLREIIPPNVQGEFYFSIKDGGTSAAPVDEIPDTAHPRAILESQFLSIRCRIEDILPSDALPLRRLVITGGASSNSTIRQLAADIFGMSVFVVGNGEAAATGGAILARFAWWRARRAQGTFDEMSRAMRAEGMDLGTTTMVAEPQRSGEITLLYERLVEVYRLCEATVVQLMHMHT